MVFSSIFFLFAFLPLCLFFYYIVLRKNQSLRNIFLLIASLVFYAWGEPIHILLMIASIIVNWYCAIMLENQKDNANVRKIWLAAGIIVDVGILLFYKYSAFFVTNINLFTGTTFKVPSHALPLGISFFTFQAISYVIDVYRGNGTAQKNPLYVGLYISFFPQLIAGPIVRYSSIEQQIFKREENFQLFSNGVERFVQGLAKKVILANSLAIIADNAFNHLEMVSSSMAWLGIFAYTLQIYYDFSGYSDMAIGLGKMFGFQFEENFKYPYMSSSVSEFWRRWHISMGAWFRDYIYFPLGGSRVSKKRMIMNLFIVWALTGLWHGADWSFVWWGLFFFVLIVIEKLTKIERRDTVFAGKLFRHFLTFFLVMMGWVLFRSDNIPKAVEYFGVMFGKSLNDSKDTLFFLRNNAYIILLSVVFIFPVKEKIAQFLSRYPYVKDTVKTIAIITIFFVSIVYTAKSAYNPFIYFNF